MKEKNVNHLLWNTSFVHCVNNSVIGLIKNITDQ